MRRFLLLSLVGLSGCGEPVEDNHFANSIELERPEPSPVTVDTVPVRIGELGASFNACNAAGTTRNLAEGGSLPVRAAPFDAAEETGAIPASARFFVCTRSHDQGWMGVVFHEGGTLDPSCGVSGPVTTARAYDGPCRSGWIASAFVKLVAG
ncbi:hypothetical protein [Allosphingosinicella sp.]|uniref:hypothetical protein n=1 Tax=Allosphingosinicella sp. TaxID=2823234 RepID=UPI002FC1A944